MGRRKKKNKKQISECVAHSVSRPLSIKTNIVLPKPRYLILSRDHPTQTMDDVPSSQLTNVINSVAGKVSSIKKQRNGTVLIETKTETQSSKLMKLKYFPPKVPVKVTAHRWLNFCKGVIKCWDIKECPIEEIRTELRSQSVVDVKPITTKAITGDGKIIFERTASYILTFALPALPKVVDLGFSTLTPTPYIPQPKMCYRCHQYGHISKYCKSSGQLCSKCGKTGHESLKCEALPTCANCSQNFQTGHSSCIGYMVHRKILEIDCFLKNIKLEG